MPVVRRVLCSTSANLGCPGATLSPPAPTAPSCAAASFWVHEHVSENYINKQEKSYFGTVCVFWFLLMMELRRKKRLFQSGGMHVVLQLRFLDE